MRFETQTDNPGTLRHAGVAEAIGVPSEESDEKMASPGKNDHICWKCQAALSPTPVQGITYLDSQMQNGLQSMWSIEASGSVETTARAGCPLCRRFVEYLSSADRDLLHSWAKEECRTRYEYSGFSDRFMHASLRLTTFLPLPGIEGSEKPSSVSSWVEFQPAKGKTQILIHNIS